MIEGNREANNLTENSDTQFTHYEKQPWVERNGFAHAAVAIAWVVIALIAFNIVGAVVGLIGILATAESLDADTITRELTNNFDIIFLANSSGQILIMALATLLVVRLHATKGNRMQYMRLQLSENVWKVSLVGAVLFVAAQPLILFLGWLNSFVPVPDVMREMQDSMAELISKFLKTENVLLLGIVHIGIVPAVCEEVMYRGYIMRALEKSWGITAAILISGLIFGAYHLQLSNILPLATLGIFLAYLTYVSNSIIPAMIAHFVNNGGQVMASNFYPALLDEQITPEMEIPYFLVLLSIFIVAGIIYYLHSIRLESQTI